MSQFLAAFERYAVTVTDAPMDFLHAAGLACLSTVSLSRRWIERGTGIHPNIFLMLLAGSSADRKSTAVRLATEMLERVEKNRVGPTDFSGEGLISSLAARGEVKPKTRIILPISEFGNYLATASRQHGTTLSPTLCQIYDGESFSRSRSGKPVQRIVKPRVSMLGGVAFGMLAKYGDPTDWVTGFYARILWVMPSQRRPRLSIIPEPDRVAERIARESLADLRLQLKAAPRALDIDPAALRVYDELAASIPEDQGDPAMAASRERLMNAVWKLALIYQIDLDHNAPISKQATDSAAQFAQRAWDSFKIAHAASSGSQLGRNANRIWAAAGGTGSFITRRELYRKLHIPVDEFMPAAQVLITLGVVRQRVKDRQMGLEVLEPFKDHQPGT